MACLFVDQLTVIDFTYLDSARGLVGESWIVDVALEGDLNNEGMVFDFGHVKKSIKLAIDSLVDHKLLLPASSQKLHFREDDNYVDFVFESEKGTVEYRSPAEAVYKVDCEHITIEQVSPVLREHLQSVVPQNVTAVHIDLYVESIESDYYHYTHGLKKHKGDCQRICHGHRSRIEIFRNGVRDSALESAWAERWRDIYLVTEEDIAERDGEQLLISYQAEQGQFDLKLPTRHCEVLNCDSTVELIAQFIANDLKNRFPNDGFRVKAYEGFNKGALAES